ncbi:OmpA/MotB domain protein [Gloeothece citriformis PCC 7424]|uniref:OmpA/MotB domain protein n=1 Tax=Gloeothece citriformis (strain PCC 7424) TaxID=65393 RepID=B7KKC3_GLOC7|nr:OmpA family protein [Gloeothece citriformis]ACK72256.1 OmpA/MotB domain protein [Gloeothece citriformis PCC 7424]
MANFPDYEIDAEELEEQDSGVWLSIGDLMSSLLMFFALLFITAQVQLLHKQDELQKYKEAIDQLPVKIIKALNETIPNSGIIVHPETGDVSLDNRILFDEGSASLKPEGKQFLQQFIPIYSQHIFSNTLLDQQIIRVIIEGHTSSKGSDSDNMELSLRRALSVSDYIFSDEINFPTKEKFQKKLLASGRGEIDAEQQTDNPSDRKVMFRFEFRRENLTELLK